MPTATPTATILIVDDSTLCRNVIAKVLTADGLGTIGAIDGMDGLARLGQQPIDAILLDYEMPKLTGLGFLKALRSDVRWKSVPVLMLSTTVARDVIIEATKYGLSGYLLKAKLSMTDMLSRLHSAIDKTSPLLPALGLPPAPTPTSVVAAIPSDGSEFAAAGPTSSSTTTDAKPAPAKPKSSPADKLAVPNMVPRDATLEALTKLSDARLLRGTVSQIKTLVSTSKATVAELSAVVKQDPILCARVLQLAASADSGSKTRIASVEDAVRTAGVNAVCDLASAMPVLEQFTEDQADGIDFLRCWHHSLVVASVMGKIVPKSDTTPAGLAELVGLVHDLPELLLRQRFPAEYGAAVDFAKQVEVPATDMMRQVFGVPYGDMIEILFDRLKIPTTIGEPISEFEIAARSTPDMHASVLARSLSIANFMAHGAFCTPSSHTVVAPVQQTDCRTVLITGAAIDIAAIRAEALATTTKLAGLNSDQEALLAKSLLPRNDARVWYIRPPTFTPLDPIEAALESLCKSETHDRVPYLEEMTNIKAFVITSAHPNATPSDLLRLCAQKGKSLPILNITRTVKDDGGGLNGVEEIQYPVSLSNLQKFIADL